MQFAQKAIDRVVDGTCASQEERKTNTRALWGKFSKARDYFSQQKDQGHNFTLLEA